ncbi:type II CRISPR RNA-guided endonuclease Cas9 [Paludibacter sp. 221]|uniref:type II CRISPR RNA-guided endonuclease Cas9 n=1 Tax=Paludibacter sp. 221 TaxID=2302939 RepID=UPI0013D13399|nr:type II CRISPR RNA-guided endonuclease Cas9 [Paludibacter sp. 221]NDV47369.1 type II CRISPR RNA-guided endonuclease Cas9 [Paludibacter sp. 221]
MKRILGLDLGTTSIGWALVNEATGDGEKSSIIKLGVRVNPLTTDELSNFEKGKKITTNADRTLKRGMRRNLQRYKLRRDNLIEILKENGFITEKNILSEDGNCTTFETYRLRAKAATEQISLEELARVLLMINKKRGYKSCRKAKSADEGELIDGMEIAKKLYDENLTPGQFVLQLLKEGKKHIPDFYRSDLQAELDRIWYFQQQFYPEVLTGEFKNQINNKGKQNTSKIFLNKYGIYTADNKGADKRIQAYQWRADALTKQLTKEEMAFVISDVNGAISNSSGYLGAISDRSKELYFNHQTVGQYLMSLLDNDPNTSLKNQVFYRQDYLDEFNTIWETQAKYHKNLTPELKREIRDVIIFYQRRLKSQKGLISFCEFESREIEIEIEGRKKKKTVGSRVCPKSSPLFQEFKIWQVLNNIQVTDKKENEIKSLTLEAKEALFAELSVKERLSKEEALKLLFKNPKNFELNLKHIEGNRTQARLFEAYQKIIAMSGHGEYDFAKLSAEKSMEIVSEVFSMLGYNTHILQFDASLRGQQLEQQPLYQLWHLLYSFEGDDSVSGSEKLVSKLSELYGFSKEHASILANVTFQDDYGSLSTKAMRKILPHMKEGNGYDVACVYAGYRHSKNSLTKDEIENKELKKRLDILPKNSLRNPVVEKILNQMINVVNGVADNYGEFDEIHIELARELKKSAGEREEMTNSINKTTAEHEKIKTILRNDFGLTHISRNDIIRYKLYEELKENGYHTLYSNTYISPGMLFSKKIDIEHIIPQSRLFDDSFSNKTLELRDINIEKGNKTACDYVLEKYGDKGLEEYFSRIEKLFKSGYIKQAKLNKLKMKESDIPDDFIERDIRDTQYIARKAKMILEDMVKVVVSTSGKVTDRLREDWQLVDVMKELNWEKYNKLGLTEIIENKDGQKIRRIKDWSKRNDHRHHAMDALTIAFTKHDHIQYLNNQNARSDKNSSVYAIEKKELYRDEKNKLRFNPPMPIKEFRAEAKKQLENTLISIKAKNKVVTSNINITKTAQGTNKKKQLTPRGQLHLETIYGCSKSYVTKEEKVGAGFDKEQIQKVCKKKYREALLKRLQEFGGDPKKAFTGKNSLSKNPVYLDESQSSFVPEKVKTVQLENTYTIRKAISPDLKIEKVTNTGIRRILENRLAEHNGDAKQAFSNLDENPIWLNEEKGIKLKRVTISGVSNAESLHTKKDKYGKVILDKEGKTQAVDFVNTGNNHHVAIYRDENGNLQDEVVSFFKATVRANLQQPIIDKEYKKGEGWQFLFSMKQNEYFVFPNEETGFNPKEIDLFDPENYKFISPNLYRVQKFSKTSARDYMFRHHLETAVKDNNLLKEIAYKRISALSIFDKIVKVRVNHIGQIVWVGEY